VERPPYSFLPLLFYLSFRRNLLLQLSLSLHLSFLVVILTLSKAEGERTCFLPFFDCPAPIPTLGERTHVD